MKRYRQKPTETRKRQRERDKERKTHLLIVIEGRADSGDVVAVGDRETERNREAEIEREKERETHLLIMIEREQTVVTLSQLGTWYGPVGLNLIKKPDTHKSA
jgi:hypothetical protein